MGHSEGTGTAARRTRLKGDPMEIGETERTIEVYPLEEPVPTEAPAELPVEQPEEVPA